ncbi:winged helix-turn-helix domain-containing protein [Thalassotalea fusca]
MTIFYIADYQVDLSRSVVIKNDAEVQVEPKVLKVLLLLAQRQNEVITHEEIMSHVWQGAEVVPNALQRCIAILRKVLGDSAKSPTIIATHPRIGYRLLAEVTWQAPFEPTNESTNTATNTTTNEASVRVLKDSNIRQSRQPIQSRSPTVAKSLVAVLIVLFLVVSSRFWLTTSPKQYTQIRQLTQTDAHESHAIFSPDGKYIVFNRYAGACKSHLWAREMSSGKERQLTAQAGYFGAPSFTKDGRELVFAAKAQCGQISEKHTPEFIESKCWSIATLDVALAMSSPQLPSFRYQCQAEKLVNPVALANHRYAFLQLEAGRYQLMHFDDLQDALQVLNDPVEEYLYHFDYDATHMRFVLISRDSDNNHLLTLLDEQGQVQRRSAIALAKGVSKNSFLYANFEPQGNHLLVVVDNQLFQLSLNGQLQAISTPETNLISVAKHPHTEHLLAVRGYKDIDIAQLKLGEEASVLKTQKSETSTSEPETPETLDLNSTQLPFNSFARTTAQERNAKFQPNGDYIAFISDSGGRDQLWLWHGSQKQASPLSAELSYGRIDNFSWSPDGKHIALIAGDKLTMIDLQGNQRQLVTEKTLYSVLDWYQDNQLLVLANDPVRGGLYQLSLNGNKLTPFGINDVESAWVLQDKLFYSNQNGEVSVRELTTSTNNLASESLPIPQLNGKAMIINDGFIYSVDNKTFVLNQYNSDGEFIKPVKRLKPTAWKVTGIKNNKLLLSQFIAIDHDIVVLE